MTNTPTQRWHALHVLLQHWLVLAPAEAAAQMPLAHAEAPVHAWPLASLQAPLPSHTSFAGQSGSVVPSVVEVQVPPEVRLHAWQAPAHALPQQTPSTHWPEAHSAPAAQVVPPCFCGWQALLASQ